MRHELLTSKAGLFLARGRSVLTEDEVRRLILLPPSSDKRARIYSALGADAMDRVILTYEQATGSEKEQIETVVRAILNDEPMV